MTTEETLKPEQSLQVISNMIHAAKNKLADDGFHIIFWGWNVTICALFHYITLRLGYQWGGWCWAIAMPLGGIISSIQGRKESKSKKVRTHVETYLAYLWGGFLIAMFITLALGYLHGIKVTYFILMLLYGVSTFITGGILNFKPLIIGSLFSFAIAIISVYMGDIDQFLCIAASLICSYIIPGHLLRSKYRSQHV